MLLNNFKLGSYSCREKFALQNRKKIWSYFLSEGRVFINTEHFDKNTILFTFSLKATRMLKLSSIVDPNIVNKNK